MSINRVPINGSTSGEVYYQGKASFCFYRKGAVGSGLTDVAVYANNEYMGLMSPTEHFRLNRSVDTWKFKPVDSALVGEFVLADSAEEYATSQVAGTVAVSSISGQSHVIVDSNAYPTKIERSDNGLIYSAYEQLPAATTNTVYVARPNFATPTTRNLYLSAASFWSSNLIGAVMSHGYYTSGAFTGAITPVGNSDQVNPTPQYKGFSSIGTVAGVINNGALDSAQIISNACKFDLDEYVRLSAGSNQFILFNITNGASVATYLKLVWMEK